MNRFPTIFTALIFRCLEKQNHLHFQPRLFMEIFSYFSLRKSKKTFFSVSRDYQKRRSHLPLSSQEPIEAFLKELKGAIDEKNHKKAKEIAARANHISLSWMHKNRFTRMKEFSSGIIFALLVAVLIRTMWFELYTIPTGSMRPTLKEEDYLVVSKTDFGINVPLRLNHFHFAPDRVQRGSIFVFNSGNIDMKDADTLYFYLFPGKKQLVKRLIGKPGDTLYFYGGKIYGIDVDGKEIEAFQKEACFQKLEHIPMMRFEGRIESLPDGSILVQQMNQPIARLSSKEVYTIGQKGEKPPSFADFLGMKHFAMARLLTADDLQKIYPDLNKDQADLFLELTHHPHLSRYPVSHLAKEHSILPLKQKHIDRIADHLTTCRFQINNGFLSRLGWGKISSKFLPRLENVPNGTYEILDGVVYELPFPNIPFLGIFTNGYTKKVKPDHPLYSRDPKTIYTLYNLGIEPLTQYLPSQKEQQAIPSRYAYFREEALYLLGSPIFEKEDPILKAFALEEEKKVRPFLDQGPPSKEEILKFGIKIPKKMYLALGDNHAMSGDSREFGFVPEENIKGSVSFLFSPLGERLGRADQPAKSFFHTSNLIVYALAIIFFSIFLWYRKQEEKKVLRS